MPDDALFDLPVAQAPRAPEGRGTPRVLAPDRTQVLLLPQDLDELVEPDHPVRAVWAYVQGLDLAALYAPIRAVEGAPGRPATDPRLLLALWLFAISQAVGSARRLEQLCEQHVAYRWLCGGVSVNYHTLADFRVAHAAALDGLLTHSVAALVAEGLVELTRLAQDGMRVRASAGAASFRRRDTLERCHEEARARVDALKAELDTDPAAGARRECAARERAARERLDRVERAQAKAQLLRARQEQAKDNGKNKDEDGNPKQEARASTTDPEATVMRMADGGYRPAVNVQFATTTTGGLIAGVAVTDRGTEEEELVPMHAQLTERYGQGPAELLVDGGYATKEQIEAMAAPELGCTVYAPVKPPRNPANDPYAPKYGDKPGVKAWRARMATDEAQAILKQRGATAEWANAQVRLDGLIRFTVRGLKKCRAVALLHALVHNLFTGLRLRRQAAAAA